MTKPRTWKAIIFSEDQDDVIAGEIHNQEIPGVKYITVQEVLPPSDDTAAMEAAVKSYMAENDFESALRMRGDPGGIYPNSSIIRWLEVTYQNAWLAKAAHDRGDAK